jgi:peptide-methionine (S)-S-oxide reductase
MPDHSAVATFAMGCFWSPEVTFRNVEGVLDAEVGYTGGHVDSPTYQQVCTGQTGHAEAVRVTYDPDRVSYEDLLEVFWTNHDPTQFNRQGPDYGPQYRSAVFVHDEAQRESAERTKAERQQYHARKVVTEITAAPTFYPAEEYHQQYLVKRGLASCRVG